jgi:HEAT repeat protein
MLMGSFVRLDALAQPAVASDGGPALAAASSSAQADAGPEQAAIAKMRSGDPAQIRAGLDDARMLGKAAAPAAPEIGRLLRDGMSLELTQAAIDTLSDIESPDGSPALAPYARHREPAIRLAAVRALAHTKGPAAVAALRAALSDADTDVRQNAANGLGALKAKDAQEELLLALDKRIPGVAGTLGNVCDEAHCATLAQKVSAMTFDVLSAAAQPLLFRADVSDDTKILFVDRMRARGVDAEANGFLRQVLRGWPPTGSRRVRAAIEQAVLATSANGGGAR